MADHFLPVDVRSALSWAFDRLKSRPAVFVGLASVVTVFQFVASIGTQPLQNILTDCVDPQTQGQTNACSAAISFDGLFPILGAVVFGLLAFVLQFGVQRAAIRSTQGVPPTFSDMLTTQYLGRYVALVIVFAILFSIGFAFCFLPSLAVVWLLQLAPYYILDKGYGVVGAVRASAQAATRNMAPAILMTLVNVLVYIVGGLLFGLLTLVTLPFGALFTAHLYRQFNREEIV